MGKVRADPNRMLLAVEYIGDHEPVTKQELFDYIVKYTDPEKDSRYEKRTEATTDLLTNVSDYLHLVERDGDLLRLTRNISEDLTFLYSGFPIYNAIKLHDDTGAFKMLQENCLFAMPETRAIIAFVHKGKRVTKGELYDQFLNKKIFTEKFNQVSLAFAIKRALEFKLIAISNNKYYPLEIKLPTFAHILIEEYASLATIAVGGRIAPGGIKDIFDLKYNMNYSLFDLYFNRLRTLIPHLIDAGSYDSFSIDLNLARKLMLYE